MRGCEMTICIKEILMDLRMLVSFTLYCHNSQLSISVKIICQILTNPAGKSYHNRTYSMPLSWSSDLVIGCERYVICRAYLWVYLRPCHSTGCGGSINLLNDCQISIQKFNIHLPDWSLCTAVFNKLHIARQDQP